MHLHLLILVSSILALTHDLWVHNLLRISNLRVDLLRWSLILLVLLILVLLLLLLLHHHVMPKTAHLWMGLLALPSSQMILITESTALHVIGT